MATEEVLFFSLNLKHDNYLNNYSKTILYKLIAINKVTGWASSFTNHYNSNLKLHRVRARHITREPTHSLKLTLSLQKKKKNFKSGNHPALSAFCYKPFWFGPFVINCWVSTHLQSISWDLLFSDRQIHFVSQLEYQLPSAFQLPVLPFIEFYTMTFARK